MIRLLSRVRSMIQLGWSEMAEESTCMRLYQQTKDELSLQDNCILWGSQIIIPEAGQSRVLDELHSEHPGVKSIASGIIWWPGIDSDLEKKVKACMLCQLSQNEPAKVPIHLWEWPAMSIANPS